jgi:hypothetical protein
MRQKDQKPRLVKIEKDIYMPVLRIPVKLKGYFVIYFELIRGNIEITYDTKRTYDGNIEGWASITTKESAVVDIYLYRLESMLFPPRFFSSRTRWKYNGGRWEAVFTHVFSNMREKREICYCYSSDTDECNCSFAREEED